MPLRITKRNVLKYGPYVNAAVRGIRAGVRYMGRRKAGRTRTVNGTARRRSKVSQDHHKGHSAGFLAKGRKPGRKAKRFSKAQNTGVVETYESGIAPAAGVSGVTDSLYLGHATFVVDRIRKLMVSCIVKKIFAKVSIGIDNWASTAAMAVGDTLYLYFKRDYDPSTAETAQSYTFAAGGTYQNIVDALTTTLSTSFDVDFHYTRVLLGQGTGIGAQFSLIGSTFNFQISSNLKVQNATRSVSGQESDQVDNVPIYGHSYSGKGTGTDSFRSKQTEAGWVANSSNGQILVIGTQGRGTAEMPSMKYFPNVSKGGRCKLDPGEIKTSRLTSNLRFKINDLTAVLNVGQLTGFTYYVNRGKFAFYGFEHMIKSSTTTPNLFILAEHNWRCCATMSVKWTNVTDQRCSINNYVTY